LNPVHSCAFRRRRGLRPRSDPQVELAGAPTPSTQCLEFTTDSSFSVL
jgi:hypothetical protein